MDNSILFRACVAEAKNEKLTYENEKLKNLVNKLSNSNCYVQMTSAIGMLPINSIGMRKAVDKIGHLIIENNELVADRDNWRETAEGHRNFTDELRNRIKEKDLEILQLRQLTENGQSVIDTNKRLLDEIDRLLAENKELIDKLKNKENKDTEEFYAVVNYGTINPFSASVWRNTSGTENKFCEYYFDSRNAGHLMTDEDYYIELKNLIGKCPVKTIYIDPSAASFIQCITRHGEFVTMPKI